MYSYARTTISVTLSKIGVGVGVGVGLLVTGAVGVIVPDGVTRGVSDGFIEGLAVSEGLGDAVCSNVGDTVIVRLGASSVGAVSCERIIKNKVDPTITSTTTRIIFSITDVDDFPSSISESIIAIKRAKHFADTTSTITASLNRPLQWARFVLHLGFYFVTMHMLLSDA